MKVGLQDVCIVPPILLRSSQALAVAGGADSLWVPDHLINAFPNAVWKRRHNALAAAVSHSDGFLDPMVALGWMAGKNRLSRLHLGVAVTDPGRRHPAVIAQAFASLHRLSRGRAILGIGTGERENNVPYGVDWTAPVARLEEALAVIRALWDSDGRPVTREGRFFPLRDALFDVPPFRGSRPPIWVASHGPRMLALTGRYGDGWLPAWPQQPKLYGSRLASIRDAAADAGRDPSRLVGSGWWLVVTGPTSGIVDDLLDSPVVRSLALAFSAEQWAAHGAEHPLGSDFTGLQDLLPHLLTEEQALAYGRLVPTSLLRESMFCGTPRQVVEQIATYRDEGLQHPVLVNAAPFGRLVKGAPSFASIVSVLRGVKRL